MLHLRLADGSDLYINSLAVRYVVSSKNPDFSIIHYDNEHFHEVVGDVKKIADAIHKALHVIHLQA